jgi:hypothetical protein
VISGWNIQINPRRIGGQRKSECGAVILSIGEELDRPESFRQAPQLAEGQKSTDFQAFSLSATPSARQWQLAERVEFLEK